MDISYLKILAAVLASIFAFWGNISYLYDTLTSKIKPHPYTWFIWSIVSLVTFFGVLVKGGGIGTIPIGIAEIFTILIFIFSLKNGFKNIPKFDHLFLFICLFGLIPWYTTSDPTISVSLVVGVDLIAFIPTLIKTKKYPTSENNTLYIMNTLRHLLILISLGNYNYVTMLHSSVMITANLLMTMFLLQQKNK